MNCRRTSNARAHCRDGVEKLKKKTQKNTQIAPNVIRISLFRSNWNSSSIYRSWMAQKHFHSEPKGRRSIPRTRICAQCQFINSTIHISRSNYEIAHSTRDALVTCRSSSGSGRAAGVPSTQHLALLYTTGHLSSATPPPRLLRLWRRTSLSSKGEGILTEIDLRRRGNEAYLWESTTSISEIWSGKQCTIHYEVVFLFRMAT
jgi:hypothetical protein